MKILVSGVQRIYGKSKKTQNQYDFARVFALSPISPKSGADYTVRAAGYEVTEMACDVEALEKFLALTFPIQLELITEARPGSGGKGFELWVTGFNPIQPVRTA
jgi:hypothetical protein